MDFVANNWGVVAFFTCSILMLISFFVYIIKNYRDKKDKGLAGILRALHRFDLQYPISPLQRNIYNMVSGAREEQVIQNENVSAIIEATKNEIIQSFKDIPQGQDMNAEKVREIIRNSHPDRKVHDSVVIPLLGRKRA